MSAGDETDTGVRARSISEEDLARLKQEREAADRRYNEALTALDRSLPAVPSNFPHPPPPPDEHQVTALNERWKILAAQPALPRGWRGRLAAFVWDLIEPVLSRQEAFNSALVDHVNRNIGPQREVPKAIDSTLALVRQQLEAAVGFQSRLIVCLQQVTPYVDTKDYEASGLARRVNEDAYEAAERVDLVARGLAGGLSGVSDELLRRFESLVARDQRYERALVELKSTIASMQQLTQTLRRQMERLPQGAPIAPVAPAAPVAPVDQLLPSDRMHSHQYVGFEDLFRGSELDVQGRMASYLDVFRGASDVLDIGCGRGELLDLLREAGITARGIDVNHEMVERCRARGLDVSESDALRYLSGLPDESLGGFIATQVVEHLTPDYLLRTLSAAFDKLKPGSTFVVETINPASWAAFFDSYIRDLTHVRPVHPDTLRYLVTASGFADATVQWRSPYPAESKLQRAPDAVRAHATGDAALATLADAFDRNVDHLNGLLFTYMDYAVIARRP
ncbi:MAG: class I SAM-dependent methyltransferase [Acidobacteria bacterium]|nr:class I SAM-dependent methyltransferase [Acidobacteriota bacterium]